MNTKKCEICGKEVPSGEAIYYEAGDYFVCKECWEDEFVKCEFCGKELPKSEATFCESAGIYACPECADEELVTCERCGDVIYRDCAYHGYHGYLCEICHDDLFG